MRHWIEDTDCRDQYSVIYEAGERTAIYDNDAKEPIVSEERAVSSVCNELNIPFLDNLHTNNVFFIIYTYAALDGDVRALVS